MKFTLIFIAAIVGVSSAFTIPQLNALQIQGNWAEALDRFNLYLGYSKTDLYHQVSRFYSTFTMNFPYYQSNYQNLLLQLGSEGEAIAASLDVAFNQASSEIANLFNEATLKERISSLLEDGTHPLIESINSSIAVLSEATESYANVANCWTDSYQDFVTVTSNFYWTGISTSIMNQQMLINDRFTELTTRIYLNLNVADVGNCFINYDEHQKCLLNYYKNNEDSLKNEFLGISSTATNLINDLFNNLAADFIGKIDVANAELAAWNVTVTDCYTA